MFPTGQLGRDEVRVTRVLLSVGMALVKARGATTASRKGCTGSMMTVSEQWGMDQVIYRFPIRMTSSSIFVMEDM